MQIIEGSAEWADRCREFCRQAYKAAYVRPELDITEDLFTKEIFMSPRIIKYFRDLLDDNRSWLALDDEGGLIGMVAAKRHQDYCEMKSLYVKPGHKGHGIGHTLYQKVREYANGQAILVDVIEYMDETIDIYRHWGFEIDESRGKLNYPIEEWPVAARKAYRAIYMVKPSDV